MVEALKALADRLDAARKAPLTALRERLTAVADAQQRVNITLAREVDDLRQRVTELEQRHKG